MSDDRPEVRLSNAEREAIVDRLKIAQDEGRIDLHEFEDRVGQVYAARVPSEVGDVLADLPAAQPPPPAGPPISQGAPAPPANATVNLHATPVHRTRWMFAVLSGRQSRGRWSPGAPNRTFTLMGSQTLDLTQVDALDVDIRAFTMMGETKIIVPPGTHVDVGGFILMGETSNKTFDEDGQSPMRVRVRSYGLMGECSVRTPGKRDAIRKIINKKFRELE